MHISSHRKKIQTGWALYDWANSAYNLVITSTIFPAYYMAVTTTRNSTGEVTGNTVRLWGAEFKNGALFDYTMAAAYLLVALLAPILSSIADYSGKKKLFMQAFCTIGAASCCGLFFFTSDTILLGLACSMLAAIGYCGSIVFYNAYLPEIATDEEQNRLSAKGFAYGYIGSVLLQIICLVFILNDSMFEDKSFPVRLSFLLVGIWWFGFAQISFSRLPRGIPAASRPQYSLLTNGFRELKNVWRQIRNMQTLKWYLAAFFLYSMGVQTVMLAAAIFGSSEIHKSDGSPLGMSELITTILIIQLVAIAGAYLMAKAASRYGNMHVLLYVIFIWIAICIAAYYTTSDIQFYLLAAAVGLVMGGIQSLSRATYARLMPETKDTTSFFSFYDVTEKIAIVIGMLSFGLIEELTGSMRNSILILIGFFAGGALLLYLAMQVAKKERQTSSII